MPTSLGEEQYSSYQIFCQPDLKLFLNIIKAFQEKNHLKYVSENHCLNFIFLISN